MPRLRARSRRGCFPLLQRGLAAVLRRNVPVPDASPEAESGGAGRPGALAGRVRRAAALVFCASLAAPLLGAGGSAEAQNTPDTTPPTLTSADVEETNGLSIYLEFSEDLQLSNPPPASAFTLTVDGSAVTGFSVAWQGSLLPQNAIWLVLPTAIRQGQVVVVTYEDPTAGDDANAIQDTAGNDAATFTTGMDGVPAVTNNSTVTNTPATGAPTITGTATVGQTLTAGTTAIMDADGLTSVSYTYQWIRVATDNTETNISGATASTYTLVAADQGTTIKVTVSFTDDASNAETLTSAATAAVAAEVTGTPEPEPFEVEIVGVPEVAVTGESYELTVQSDEDSLVYAWRVDGGAIEPDDVQMVVWTAPETAGVAWIHVDVTREDGAKAGQSAYVRVEVPEPEPEPVPALPLLGQLLLALGLAGAGAMRLVRSARRP